MNKKDHQELKLNMSRLKTEEKENEAPEIETQQNEQEDSDAEEVRIWKGQVQSLKKMIHH